MKEKSEYNIEGFLDVYQKTINFVHDMVDPFERVGYPPENLIHSVVFEVMAATLMNDRKKEGDGTDLTRHEIKASNKKGSYEYQYHRITWRDKLEADKIVDHIYISHRDSYSCLDVYKVPAHVIAPKIETWIPKAERCYASSAKAELRCRCSVGKRWVQKNGKLILSISDYKLQDVI